MRGRPWLGLGGSVALHACVVALALALGRSEEPLPALIIDLREPFVAGSASVRPPEEGKRLAPSSRAPRSTRVKTDAAGPAHQPTPASPSAPPAPASEPAPAPRPAPVVEAPAAPDVHAPPAPVVQAPPDQPPLRQAPPSEPVREPLPPPLPPAREVAQPRSASALTGGVAPSEPPRSSGGSGVAGGSGASDSSEGNASAGITRSGSASGGAPGPAPTGFNHGAVGSREGSGGAGSAVAAVPPGGSGGSVAGSGAAEYGPYLTALRRRIQQSLRYPASARRRGVAGTVNVEILILPDGTIGGVTLLESSTHPVLDEAALDTIRSLPRMPFPRELPPRPLRVRVPVVFEMR